MKIKTLIDRHGGVCVYCRKEVAADEIPPHPDAPSRDHFIPLARGGAKGAGNMVLACYDCNRSKGSIDPRLILLAWLWLDPDSFVDAVEKVAAVVAAHKPVH